MPKSEGHNVTLLVTCGLTRLARVFSCTKHITGEETIKILLQGLFSVYGAPFFSHCVHVYGATKQINSYEDVRVHSHIGWYKRVLTALNVQVSTGIPYDHASNALCERQIRALKKNVRLWCKSERTKEVRKSHCHVFLGGLDPGQTPLKTLLLMLRLT